VLDIKLYTVVQLLKHKRALKEAMHQAALTEMGYLPEKECSRSPAYWKFSR